MDNVSGKADWFKEDQKEAKPKKETKKVSKKKMNLPDFGPLEKLVSETKKYYERVPNKNIGDFIVHLDTVYALSKKLNN